MDTPTPQHIALTSPHPTGYPLDTTALRAALVAAFLLAHICFGTGLVLGFLGQWVMAAVAVAASVALMYPIWVAARAFQGES